MTISAQSDMKPPENMFHHLQTSTSTFRLNQIEKVRANGVGDLVALPQLVVCGDQSTGKSSVLEAITGIPFPRKEGLCTRFPTEIILRHSETFDSLTIAASIRPHASRGQEEMRTLSAYRKTVQNMSELPIIIDDVSRLLQLRGYTTNDGGLAFGSDALRIEITGPIGLHLSIVDLPGLISVPNEEQTQEDVDSVHDMVRTYLHSSRTIILAVLQAGNDMANQPIIKLAREYDPDGERTVGIITKPDLINEGAEAKLALVAKNQDVIKLKLGFFLLKNPTPSEIHDGITMETRASRELRFFSSPVWAAQGLDPNRLGAERLRGFLQGLLDTHIERELPKVAEEIRKKLDVNESELKSLGEARPAVGQIRAFLTNLSMNFYELTQAALDGSYHSTDAEFFSGNDACRLRAQIQAENTKFASCMRENGERRKVGSPTSASESADETAQLVVSQEEMRDWVKQVCSIVLRLAVPALALLLC
jgi:GTP-binding protein EngB required for normal cell division